MLRSGRSYVHAVEKRINQLQAYVERMRAATGPKAHTGGEGPQNEASQAQTPEELDIRLGEIRALLSQFKSAASLNAKKLFKSQLESRLSSLDRVVSRL
jgi:hypothetical protein